MPDLLRGAAALLPFLLASLAPVAAQVPAAPALLDSLPPLRDSLRVYGTVLSTRAALPGFGDAPLTPLTLGEAVGRALASNPVPEIAALEARQAANDATPGNAGYRPRLTAEGGFTGSRSEGAVRRSASGAEAGLTAGYTIFDATRPATLRRLRADARRFGLLAEAEAEALAFAVTEAYLDVARQQALVASRADAVALSEARLRIEQSEVEIGTAAEIDAALALADLNADRGALLRQRLGLEAAQAVLAGLMAAPQLYVAADSLALGPRPDLGALTAAAVTDNRRARALEAALEAAQARLAEVRGEYLPTVQASAGVGVVGGTTGLFPSGTPVGGTDVRYGVSVALPLLDGGSRRRRAENARLGAAQARLGLEDARLTVGTTARRLAQSVDGYRALADLEAQNAAIARQNVRVALEQLRLGFITPLDLRQVQLAQLDAEARRIEAVYQARRAEAQLRFLAGDLLPG